MSVIAVTNVTVKRNPSPLTEPFELEVSFECLEPLQEDLEWKLIYVGDPEDKSNDQELDYISLGPIQRGALRFTFVTDAPDFSRIKKENIHGITIILLTGSYRNQEFVRVGWYLHNFFPNVDDGEKQIDIDEMSLDEMLRSMQRMILADAPRVTRFQIDWDKVPELAQGEFSEAGHDEENKLSQGKSETTTNNCVLVESGNRSDELNDEFMMCDDPEPDLKSEEEAAATTSSHGLFCPHVMSSSSSSNYFSNLVMDVEMC